MLLRSVILIAVLSAAATQVPAVMNMFMQKNDQTQPVAQATKVPVNATAPSGQVVLKADSRGHYNASFKINGKPLDGLVDTGASYVAINESMARRLGFGVNSLDFRHPVATANGQTKAALIRLDRIEIGSIRVRDVDALVLRDNALSTMLVGMSFLNRLKSFASRDGAMQLGG